MRPSRAITPERRANGRIQQHVPVSPGSCAEAGIELIAGGDSPAHRDRRRQKGVDASNPRARGPVGWGVELHDLLQGMNAGIGAAGAAGLHGVTGNLRQRGLDDVLQRGLAAEPRRLRLPAAEAGAVVRQAADPAVHPTFTAQAATSGGSVEHDRRNRTP
jgi:hypothetical protein